MDLLKRRIHNDGLAVDTEIVRVDSFLNHQLDIALFMAIGKEIKRRFGHLGINKILTLEPSGIAIASITAMYFDLPPVVFAERIPLHAVTEEYYAAKINTSLTDVPSASCVLKAYLNQNDTVLILDSFLAHGEVTLGLCSLVEQAGGTVCGIVGIIEKEFQGGSKKLREAGYYVDSLAVITKIENGEIYFKD